MEIYRKPFEGFVLPDGLTWKKISFNSKETIQNLDWSSGGFVAVGVKHIFTSRDGENWTTTYTLNNQYGADSLKVVNGTYFVSSSSDGYVLVTGISAWATALYIHGRRVLEEANDSAERGRPEDDRVRP